MNRIKRATEAELASAILNTTRQLPDYVSSKGNRYTARTQTALKAGSSGWVEQDINSLFKTGSYSFTVPVRGKTSDYKVSIVVEDFLQDLNELLKTEKFLSKTIQKALQKAITVRKIKISCTCADFLYRHAHAQTIAGNKAGAPETRPSVKTNPENRKGTCKHIVAVLTNKSWIPQVATNLHTYVMTIYKRNKKLFDAVIRKSLNNITDVAMGDKEQPIPPMEEITPIEATPVPQQESKPEEAASKEEVNGSYKGAQQYDDDQNLMIAVAKDGGADVLLYITPENTPEQIMEIAEAIKLQLSEEFLKKLANTNYSPMTIEILAKIKKEHNLDWTRYDGIHPKILLYLSKYYDKTGLTPQDFRDGVTLREVQLKVKEINTNK